MTTTRETAIDGSGAEPERERRATVVPALPGLLRGQWLAGALGFVVLTAAVFWWQFGSRPATGATLGLSGLRWGHGLLLLLLLPAETLLSATRMWFLCRAVHPGVRFWACVQSEWANVAMSLLTPSQSGGGPGLVYVLHRTAGVPVGAGVTLAVLSGLATMAGLLVLGVYSLVVSGIGARGPLFAAAAGTITALAGAALLGAVRPDGLRDVLAALSRAVCRGLGSRGRVTGWWPPAAPRTGPPVDRMDAMTARLVDVLYAYQAGIRGFVRNGKASLAAVGALSVGFLLTRALLAYSCVRFLGVSTGSLHEILDAQIGLIFLVFFAPTPGGAGIAEGASFAVMGGIVPPHLAPLYTLLWRTTTTYVAALAGFVCLGRALTQDAWRLARRGAAPR